MSLLALVGCSHADVQIPGSARLVEGGGGSLRYVAEENGRIYLLDANVRKSVFDAHIDLGETITIDPDHDVINVAGKPADHKTPLSSDHLYRLYFDRDS